MNTERRIDSIRFRKFSPLDRESPIFEILYDDRIIMDFSKNEADGKSEIIFYEGIVDKSITADLLAEIIEMGNILIKKEEE